MSDFTESGLTYEEPSAGTSCCGPSPADYAPIAEPVVAEPVLAEPVVNEPVIAEPAVAEPVVAEPVVAQPIVAEPVIAEPAQAAVQQTPLAEPSVPSAPATIAVIGGPTPGVTSPVDVFSPALRIRSPRDRSSASASRSTVPLPSCRRTVRRPTSPIRREWSSRDNGMRRTTRRTVRSTVGTCPTDRCCHMTVDRVGTRDP